MNQKEICSKSTYELSIYADDHVYVVAKPMRRAMKKGCLPLAFHDRGVAKTVMVIDEPEMHRNLLEDGYVYDNKFKLADVAKAFEAADSIGNAKPYDVLGNNCGKFVVTMLGHLGIRKDESYGAMEYVVEQLEKSGHVASLYRNSTVSIGKIDDDHTLLSVLVEETVDVNRLF